MGDLIYTCVQLIHNFGAVTVVGSPAVALWLGQDQKVAQTPACLADAARLGGPGRKRRRLRPHQPVFEWTDSGRRRRRAGVARGNAAITNAGP